MLEAGSFLDCPVAQMVRGRINVSSTASPAGRTNPVVTTDDPDAEARLAAFARLRQLQAVHGTTLPWSAIDGGFDAGGQHYHLASQAEGIFKPARMRTLLSIKTVVPRAGRRVWYQDQQPRDRAFTEGAETLAYAFKGTNPDDPQNRLLRDARDRRLPVIWFYGIAPGLYEAIYPVFVAGWHPDELVADIAPALPEMVETPLNLSVAERRYATRQVRQRLHQRMFRAQVVAAYRHRCVLTGLPVADLVDAAHIMPDLDADLGQPDVRNGIAMSRLHHAAFDGNLIGIDPDYRVHVAPSLREVRNGPLLNLLKNLEGQDLRSRLPAQRTLWPDPQRLEVRFQRFRENAKS